MRDISAEVRDEIKTRCKAKKIKRTELCAEAKVSFHTFRNFITDDTRDISLKTAQKILDYLGLELLVFEKDEQFNDKYDCKP